MNEARQTREAEGASSMALQGRSRCLVRRIMMKSGIVPYQRPLGLMETDLRAPVLFICPMWLL